MLSGKIDSAASETRVIAVVRLIDGVRKIRSSIRSLPLNAVELLLLVASRWSHEKDNRLWQLTCAVPAAYSCGLS